MSVSDGESVEEFVSRFEERAQCRLAPPWHDGHFAGKAGQPLAPARVRSRRPREFGFAGGHWPSHSPSRPWGIGPSTTQGSFAYLALADLCTPGPRPVNGYR